MLSLSSVKAIVSLFFARIFPDALATFQNLESDAIKNMFSFYFQISTLLRCSSVKPGVINNFDLAILLMVIALAKNIVDTCFALLKQGIIWEY